MLILLVAALLLQAPDAGAQFEPVIVDVHHGEVWLTAPDGGYSDAPVQLGSSVCMDEPTAVYLARDKARARGERSVGPEVDTRTVLTVALVMFVVGAVVGGAAVAVAVLK